MLSICRPERYSLLDCKLSVGMNRLCLACHWIPIPQRRAWRMVLVRWKEMDGRRIGSVNRQKKLGVLFSWWRLIESLRSVVLLLLAIYLKTKSFNSITLRCMMSLKIFFNGNVKSGLIPLRIFTRKMWQDLGHSRHLISVSGIILRARLEREK